jgi:hypothetical protein
LNWRSLFDALLALGTPLRKKARSAFAPREAYADYLEWIRKLGECFFYAQR